ncbi:MAG: hypothetical protein IKW08_05810 [Roseburia sp.]|nr:hypothetical protein [Roseburia sp.]
MGRCDKSYTALNEKERRRLVEEWYECIVRDFRKEIVKDDFYRYEVIIQNIKFITYMTDEEVRLSAEFAIDLLEELKRINNNGIKRNVYEEIMGEMEREEESNIFRVIGIWNKISTEEMAKLFTKINMARRVGGAYAILIANPGLISAICAVYEQLVDRFEDEEMYNLSGYFLLRAIMKMNSSECEDETEQE